MHEQFRNYPGHWYCFCPGPTIGRTICNTPVNDYGDREAHSKVLKEAKQPKWCPLSETKNEKL
jgi:hypothetical protein